MKLREWSQTILRFVFGAVSMGALIFIFTAYGTRAAVGLTLEQRVAALEQRVNSLEAAEDARSKEDKHRTRPGGKADQ